MLQRNILFMKINLKLKPIFRTTDISLISPRGEISSDILGKYTHIDTLLIFHKDVYILEKSYMCIFLSLVCPTKKQQSMHQSVDNVQEPKCYISPSLRNVVICSWTEPLTGTEPIEGEESAFSYRKKFFIKLSKKTKKK